MTKVLFLPEVVDQFLELAEALYNKGYLGFRRLPLIMQSSCSGIYKSTYLLRSRRMLLPILKGMDKACSTHYSQEIIIPHGTYFTVSMN